MSISQKEGGTRSGLVWELLRIIKECENKPQILLMENVPQVHSKDNNNDFYFLQIELQKLGYKNFWQDMNSKNYGIPQNRNRTFMLSIYDKNVDYVFPEPEPLKLKLKDMLEENVDEKYYLSEKMIDYIVADNEKWTGNNNKSIVNKTIASTLNTGEGSERCDASNYELVEDEREENVNLKEYIKLGNYGNGHHAKDITDPKGISPTITTGNHGLGQVIADSVGLKIKNANSKGYEIAEEGDGIDISSRMESHRGTVQKGMTQTIKTQCENGVVVKKNE